MSETPWIKEGGHALHAPGRLWVTRSLHYSVLQSTAEAGNPLLSYLHMWSDFAFVGLLRYRNLLSPGSRNLWPWGDSVVLFLLFLFFRVTLSLMLKWHPLDFWFSLMVWFNFVVTTARVMLWWINVSTKLLLLTLIVLKWRQGTFCRPLKHSGGCCRVMLRLLGSWWPLVAPFLDIYGAKEWVAQGLGQRPWASSFTSLRLSFLIYIMGIVVFPFMGFSGEPMRWTI